eukprot:TRINITY_DN29826_c0_g1_i1.p1 TRINITY_DN29826_c0_g1~~TRINITY_DN29826_c0_g1_i1.p1  ORF type:complete len:512 (+),score=48.85 TRINITY_DN29826_c0_g1_i1:188-1723(+)
MSEVTWFTPARMLVIFCLMNTLVYIDRGALSSNAVNGSRGTGEGNSGGTGIQGEFNLTLFEDGLLSSAFMVSRAVNGSRGTGEGNSGGTGIQGEFNLTLFEDGLLSSAFMVGLLIACPLFAELSKHYNGFRLIGIGQLVWSIAVLFSGMSQQYWMLIISRMFVGVGEASFITLAAPFIDDNAPSRLKSLWLSLFYMCCPAGFALGYIMGGIIAASRGWRAVFFIEAAAMTPFVIFGFTAKKIDLKRNATVERPEKITDAIWTFLRDVRTLLSHSVYVMTTVGYTLLIGVLGVYSYWGPRAAKEAFDLSGTAADTIVGLATVVTGIGGTILGGIVLDWKGATMFNAMIVNGVGILFGCVAAIVAFVGIYSIYGFVPVFGLAEIGIFLANAPVIAVQLWSVPVVLRPLGAAVSTVCIHVFGDVPSPPIIGAVQGYLQSLMDVGTAWRISMTLTSAVLALSAFFMFLGAYFARTAVDYRKTVQEHESGSGNESNEESRLVLELSTVNTFGEKKF